jgi:hypothetical protein
MSILCHLIIGLLTLIIGYYLSAFLIWFADKDRGVNDYEVY